MCVWVCMCVCVCVCGVITKVTSYVSCVSQARGSPTFITAFVQMAVPFLSHVEGMEGGKARKKAAAGGLPGQGRYSRIVSSAKGCGIVFWFIQRLACMCSTCVSNIQFLFLCLSSLSLRMILCHARLYSSSL